MTCLLLKIIIDVIPVNIYTSIYTTIRLYNNFYIYVMLQKLIIFKYMR